MALLHNELARWRNGQLELRPQPLRVKWTFDDVVTGDGHALRLTFSCSVAALPDPTEQKMLREVLLEWRSSVTDETIVAHFTPALRAAADRIAESRTVAVMLGDEGKLALADALKTAGNAVAFACGVEIVPPLLVEAHSPTLQQQRLHAVQRSLAEQQAAGHMEHLQRAGAEHAPGRRRRRAEMRGHRQEHPARSHWRWPPFRWPILCRRERS